MNPIQSHLQRHRSYRESFNAQSRGKVVQATEVAATSPAKDPFAGYELCECGRGYVVPGMKGLACRRCRDTEIVVNSLERTMQNGKIGTWQYQPEAELLVLGGEILTDFCRPELRAPVSRRIVNEWIHADDRPRVSAAFARHLNNEAPDIDIAFRVMGGDGQWRHVIVCGRLLESKDGKAPRELQGTFVDVTDRATLEEELWRGACFDSITNLPNRNLLRDKLDRTIRRSRRIPPQGFTFAMIDIDRFRLVNETLGHEDGDVLLRIVAERLSAACRAQDHLSSLGGDVFGLILGDTTDPLEASGVVRELLTVLRLPIDFRGRRLELVASAGLVVSGGDYPDADSLLRDASTALDRARKGGRGSLAIFDRQMQEAVSRQLTIENSLTGAATRGEFSLRFQPIVSVANGSLCGFEALVRWNHPEQGMIAPDTFIAIAEETGHIQEIGRWVLREACETLASWQSTHRKAANLWMTVNVSPAEALSDSFLDNVKSALADTGIAPACLGLEITEGTLIRDPERVAKLIEDLHAIGVRVYLDDFGTGYSSLAYLGRFPVDAVKIDRSFLRNQTDSKRTQDIMAAIMTLGRALGFETVAEGVEDDSHKDLLHRLQCDYAQGYAFGKPLESAAAESVIRAATMRMPAGLPAEGVAS